MKIVKRGTPPEEHIWKGTCLTCSTVAEATGKEVAVHFDQREGQWATANCPVCNKQMNFYSTEEL